MFLRAHSLQPASHLPIQPLEVPLLSFSTLSPSGILLLSLLLACLQAPPSTIPFSLSFPAVQLPSCPPTPCTLFPRGAARHHAILHLSRGVPAQSPLSSSFFFPFSQAERRSFLPPLPFLSFPSRPRTFSSPLSRAAAAPLPGKTRALQAPLSP